MARKEINVFGASFLDLLSGALGAVIILYILVNYFMYFYQDEILNIIFYKF